MEALCECVSSAGDFCLSAVFIFVCALVTLTQPIEPSMHVLVCFRAVRRMVTTLSQPEVHVMLNYLSKFLAALLSQSSRIYEL